MYALSAKDLARAAFLCSSRTLQDVRRLHDGDGRFLYHPPPCRGVPSRMLDFPIFEDDHAPYRNIALGNWREVYRISSSPVTKVLRNPFSKKPWVLFHAKRHVTGVPYEQRGCSAMKPAKIVAATCRHCQRELKIHPQDDAKDALKRNEHRPQLEDCHLLSLWKKRTEMMTIDKYDQSREFLKGHTSSHPFSCRTKVKWPKPEKVRQLTRLDFVEAPLMKEREWRFRTAAEMQQFKQNYTTLDNRV